MISTQYSALPLTPSPAVQDKGSPAAIEHESEEKRQGSTQQEQQTPQPEGRPTRSQPFSREQAVTRLKRSLIESLSLPGENERSGRPQGETGDDSALAHIFGSILKRVAGQPVSTAGVVDELPKDATFSRWWSHFYDTFQSADYLDWAKSIGLDTATVAYSPKDGSLSGTVNGQPTVFLPGDDSGWTQVAAPIWAASQVVAPNTTSVRIDDTFKSDAAPFEAIADFYGELLDAPSQVASARADQILQSSAFAPLDPDDLSRQADDRTPHMLDGYDAALKQHRTQYAEQKRGDSQLASRYAGWLDSRPADTLVELPPTSALGTWWSHLHATFQGQAYVEWVKKTGLDPTSVIFSAVDGSLSGQVNGKQVRFTQDDDSGWAQVSEFIWEAAKIAAPGVDAIRVGTGFTGSNAPPEVVAAFYGEQRNPFAQDALVRAAALNSSNSFTPVAANDPLRGANARSRMALEAHQQAFTAHQQAYATRAAREAGDSELAGKYRTDLLAARAGHTRANVYTSGIPQASGFGQAWQHFHDTLQSQDYLDWAKKTRIDTSTATFFVQNGCLSARVDGELKHFTQTDSSGWAQVSGPIWKAAMTAAPQTESLSTKPPFSADTAPFEVIADFYGEQHDITPSQARDRATILAQTPKFVPLDPSDPMRPPALRSPEGIEQQRQDLLHHRERYAVHASADSELAARYGEALKAARGGEVPSDAQVTGISPYSTFGGWWQQLYAVFQNPEYLDWAKRNAIDTASVSFSPKDGSLTANVNGQPTTFTQAQDPEWAYVSQPIWAAAQVAVPNASAICTDATFKPDSAPLERVGEFYGEDTALTGAAATARADALATSKTFTDTDPDNPLRRPKERTQAALETQRRELMERYGDYRTRRAGDAELAAAYGTAQLKGLAAIESGDPSQDTSPSVSVPADSTLGQWWHHFTNALQSPAFLAWITDSGVDPSSMKLDPEKGTLSTRVGGKELTFTLHDSSGWAQVSGPIRDAGKLFVGPHRNLIDLSNLDSQQVPLLTVAQFYGENLGANFEEIRARATRFKAGDTFGLPSQVAASSPQALAHQQQVLADAADKHSLLVALMALYNEAKEDPSVDITSRLKDTDMEVEPGSSFSNNNDLGLEDQISLHGFLSNCGVSVPTTLAQLANMIAVLSIPLPPAPVDGNYWGLMSRSQALSNDQKTHIQDAARLAAQTLGATQGGLFNAFAEANSSLVTPIDSQALQGQSNPEAILSRLLASPEAQALGQKLESPLSDVSPASSNNERVLAALVLDLDPDAGKQRNQVAGFDLASPANRGHTAATIFQRLVDHLVSDKNIRREMAPAAAHLLLAGAAPQFLVKDLPADLRYGSHTWASMSAAVSRIEQSNPGASSRMTFEQIMSYGNTAAVTPESAIIEHQAQADAAVDWAVSKGVIERNDTEVYTPAQVTSALDAFNKDIEISNKHAEAFAQPVPSLYAKALSILQEKYGPQYDYTTPVARFTTEEGKDSQLHSAVDLYIEGKLDSVIKTGQGVGVDIGHGQYINSSRGLPDVKAVFDKDFDEYQKNAFPALAYSIEQKISMLPQEEQDRLRTGHVEIYALHQVDQNDPPALIEGELSHSPARQGVIIKVHGKTPQDPSILYEYFPFNGVFQRRDDIPNHFPYIRTPRRPNEFGSEGMFRDLTYGVPLKVDYSAYITGSPPEAGKSSAGIRMEKIAPGRIAYGPQSMEALTRWLSQSIGGFVFDKAFWHGQSSVKTEHNTFIARMEWMRSMYIPGMNTFEEFKQNGNTGAAQLSLFMDLFGFVVPAGKTGAQVARFTGRLGRKLFTAPGNVVKTIARAFKSGMRPSNVIVGAAGKTGSIGSTVGASVINPRAAATANKLSGHVSKLSGPVTDFDLVIPGGVQTFVDTANSDTLKLNRLNIVVHGEGRSTYQELMGIYSTPVSAVVNHRRITPKKLFELLRANGVDPKDEYFQTVRLLMCNSANGGSRSFAAQFRAYIKKPLKAFEGSVFTSYDYVPEGYIAQEWREQMRNLNLAPGVVRKRVVNAYKSGAMPFEIYTENPFSIVPFTERFNPYEYVTYDYRPVKF
ncbi:hypothetical protein METHPM2_1250008 [Pseudomonas sp. PM2]|jgi:hypothetical protein|uniref:hypothetical protein n=1 Tax=Pseudomonas TaxID=286 RepID=UPI00249B40A8|nr:hypothetical protein [Pseudomonas sp. PS01296]